MRRVGVHGLRHSHVYDLLQRGASMPAIQGELGHADLTTTAKYASLAPRERAEGVLKLYA